MGVAWRVVADDRLLEFARQTAQRLAQLPPLSVRAMKRVLRHTGSADFEQALRLESEATAAGFMDPQTTRLLKDFRAGGAG
jgi:enoyl-CoA hydratase/carnithine racemase